MSEPRRSCDYEKRIEDIPIRVKNDILNHFYLFPPYPDEDYFDDESFLEDVWNNQVKEVLFFFGYYKLEPTRRIFPFFLSVRVNKLSQMKDKVPFRKILNVHCYTYPAGRSQLSILSSFESLKSLEQPSLDFASFKHFKRLRLMSGFFIPESHNQLFEAINTMLDVKTLHLSFFSAWEPVNNQTKYGVFYDTLKDENFGTKKLEIRNLKDLELKGLYSPNIFLTPSVQKSLTRLKLTYVWNQELFNILPKFRSLRTLNLEQNDLKRGNTPRSKITDVSPLFNIPSLRNLILVDCPIEFIEKMKYVVFSGGGNDESEKKCVIDRFFISYRKIIQPILYGIEVGSTQHTRSFEYSEMKDFIVRLINHLQTNENLSSVKIDLPPTNLAFDAEFFDRKNFSFVSNISDKDLIPLLIKNYDRNICQFSLEGSKVTYDDTATLLCDESFKLVDIHFDHCEVERRAFQKILSSEHIFKDLKRLRLSDCKYSIDNAPLFDGLKVFPKLEVLRVYQSHNPRIVNNEYTGKITDEIWKLMRILPKDQPCDFSFHINENFDESIGFRRDRIEFKKLMSKTWVRQITSPQFLHFFENSVTDLFIGDCTIEAEDLKSFSMFRNVTSLNFFRCKIHCPKELAELVFTNPDTFGQLTRCYITQSSIWGEEEKEDDEEVFGSRVDRINLPRLEILNLVGFENIPFRFFELVALEKKRMGEDVGLGSLKKLYCTAKDEEMKEKIQQCLGTEEIGVSFFSKVRRK